VTVALISQSSVRVLGLVLMMVGLGGCIVGPRLRRWNRTATGAGAFLGTGGAVLVWRSLGYVYDGPPGWTSVRRVFASTFGSWPWVGVFALVAAIVWLGVSFSSTRRWDGLRALAILAGTALAAVGLGLVDQSISSFLRP
jgi:hypothetical protein